MHALSVATANAASELQIAKPLETAEGDLLLVVAANQGGSVKSLVPTGDWTAVPSTAYYQGKNVRMGAWYKIAGPSEPASYRFTLSGSPDDMSGGILAIAGANVLAPIDASLGQVNGHSKSVTAPSVTTTVPNALLVFGGACPKTVTFSPPTGMAELWDVASSGTYKVATETAAHNVSSTGPTGTRVATAASHCRSVAVSIAVAPAPAAP